MNTGGFEVLLTTIGGEFHAVVQRTELHPLLHGNWFNFYLTLAANFGLDVGVSHFGYLNSTTG